MKKFILLAGLLAVSFSGAAPLVARAQGGDTVKLKANKAVGQWGDKGGLSLEGTAAQPARVTHPQLDVAAPKISVSFDNKRQFTGVAASGGVQFKVSLTQKDGPPVRIEARCDSALMQRGEARTLTLSGGVDGWYQMGSGAKNSLRGQSVKLTSRPGAAETLIADVQGDANGIRLEVPPPGKDPKGGTVTITAQNAVLRQQKDSLSADVDGGARGVRLEIPAPKTSAGNAAPGGMRLGAVVVTSQRATVRQAEGTARFIGNARAASSDGEVKFDVSADELMVTRAASGELDAVKTTGRAKVKLDLPTDKNAEKPAEGEVSFGRPNYLEVEANNATAQLAKNTLLFEGAVQGFYRLPITNAKPGQPASTDLKFSGERAIVTYNPDAKDAATGLSVEISDPVNQAQIEVPGFKIDNF